MVRNMKFIAMILAILIPVVMYSGTIDTRVLSPIGKSSGHLNIHIDPRIELLCVIQYLAGSSMVCADDMGYANAI
ncbi:MAG: hypothetical protein U1C33_08940, partial [Candidatus Cloacimonadaceae bacterium]|nr:hypothetical protein [Candidatus Cloacimonadaceae bacterium]